jgi:cytochrome c553
LENFVKKIIIPLMAAVFAMASGASMAADANAGQAKSATCVGCHGANGISSNGLWPNLAGQKEAYLAKQIKDFRDGKRNDPMMAAMVKTLSDTDINNLAAYYANMK